MHLAVSVELDLNLSTLERNVYTYVDLLSDVGGIQGILFSFFAILVSILNLNSFDDMLIGKLYQVRKEKKRSCC